MRLDTLLPEDWEMVSAALGPPPNSFANTRQLLPALRARRGGHSKTDYMFGHVGQMQGERRERGREIESLHVCSRVHTRKHV